LCFSASGKLAFPRR